MGRAALVVVCLLAGRVEAASVRDATGRTVAVPDHPARILPAGPPASVLLAALAPDLIVGWPHPLSPAQKALLPAALANVPTVPMLTGHSDETASVAPLHPDLIVDYGTVDGRYVALDEGLQARTGVPTLLFPGGLAAVPQTLRTLGGLLGRQARAEALASAVERVLAGARANAGLRVVYARGADGMDLAAPGSAAADPFDVLGWTVLAPPGEGPVRHVTGPDAIERLHPDILIFEDPAMRAVVAHSAAWRAVDAVGARHAFVAPDLPFGWLGKPPSINRLLGVAAFAGGVSPVAGSACFLLALINGRPPSLADITMLTAALRPIGAAGD